MQTEIVTARSLVLGDIIKNPESDFNDLIILNHVGFVSGDSHETDNILFSCEHGSSGMSANKKVEKVTNAKFEHLPEQKGELDDYWLTWIGDSQSDGHSQYGALNSVVVN